MSYSAFIRRSWNENRLLSALLELTYDCNLDCVFCYNDRNLIGQALSLQQYQQLLDDLCALGVLGVTLSGGEPLAHPRFFEIARYARRLGFVIRIKTNGHAMKDTVARRVRQEVDPFQIDVSLHGSTASTHDRQTRVPGSFERLVANVRVMTALGLRVKANSVLTQWNAHEIEGMRSLCQTLGIRLQIGTEVTPRDDGHRGPLEIQADAAQLARYRQSSEAERQKAKAEKTAVSRFADEGSPDKQCGAGSNHVAIDPYGNVLPCVQWRVPVGNLHDQRISDVWGGSRGLEEVRATTRAARDGMRKLGDAAKGAQFCAGTAHTYYRDPLAIYPPVRQRIQESGRARLRLPVL